MQWWDGPIDWHWLSSGSGLALAIPPSAHPQDKSTHHDAKGRGHGWQRTVRLCGTKLPCSLVVQSSKGSCSRSSVLLATLLDTRLSVPCRLRRIHISTHIHTHTHTQTHTHACTRTQMYTHTHTHTHTHTNTGPQYHPEQPLPNVPQISTRKAINTLLMRYIDAIRR